MMMMMMQMRLGKLMHNIVKSRWEKCAEPFSTTVAKQWRCRNPNFVTNAISASTCARDNKNNAWQTNKKTSKKHEDAFEKQEKTKRWNHEIPKADRVYFTQHQGKQFARNSWHRIHLGKNTLGDKTMSEKTTHWGDAVHARDDLFNHWKKRYWLGKELTGWQKNAIQKKTEMKIGIWKNFLEIQTEICGCRLRID